MANKNFNLFLNSKINNFNKTIEVDSDKSLSIRSFIIGSICQGISFAENVLESGDVKSTIATCKKLGVKIEKIKPILKCHLTKRIKNMGYGLG